MIRFAPIPVMDIADFLTGAEHMPAADAQLLAQTAGGSIGRALATDIETYRESREPMLKVLISLTVTNDREQLLRSAEELAAAKDRDEYERLLDVLESLIRDAWALRLGRPGETILNRDLLVDLQKIAGEIRSDQAAAWLTQIEELRGALEVNINRRVASDALFLSMEVA